MADVNPAEVSAILKKQLEGFSSASAMDEVGTVLEVGDGIARVFGLTNAQYGELVSFEEELRRAWDHSPFVLIQHWPH